jgi:hypothetical protein
MLFHSAYGIRPMAVPTVRSRLSLCTNLFDAGILRPGATETNHEGGLMKKASSCRPKSFAMIPLSGRRKTTYSLQAKTWRGEKLR